MKYCNTAGDNTVEKVHQTIKEAKEKERIKMGTDVLYLCNKKQCGEVCPNPECNLTLDISWAANFRAVTDEDGKILYYEEIVRE